MSLKAKGRFTIAGQVPVTTTAPGTTTAVATTTAQSSTTANASTTAAATTTAFNPSLIYSHPALGDEFVKLAGWRDFRTAYGITGGVQDVTTQLENAISLARTGSYSNVLWLGSNNGAHATYRISSTVTQTGGEGVYVFCESPELVTIEWNGGDDGYMFDINGARYCKLFHRCTMHTEHVNCTAMYVGWDGSNSGGKAFDTGNEIADVIFTGGWKCHIMGGFRGYGFSETSIMRCRFYNARSTDNSTAGAIRMGNPNAMDTWVWNCYFYNCERGVTNFQGTGNFHVFNSIFVDCKYDMHAQGTEQFAAHGNVSVNSQNFMQSGYNRPNVSEYVFSKNRIFNVHNPEVGSHQWSSIFSENNAAIVALDNQHVLTPDPATGYPFEGAFRYGGETITLQSVGEITNRDNGYVQNMNGINLAAHINEYDLSIVGNGVIDQTIPQPHPIQPIVVRPTYTVTQGLTQAAIQAIINNADNLSRGNRPVVYMTRGTHAFVALSVPTGSDIQIWGDGIEDTILTGTIYTNGFTKLTLRNLKIAGVNAGFAPSETNQTGSRIYAHEMQFFFNNTKGIEVTNSNIPIYIVNSGIGYGSAVGVKISGGTGTTNIIASQGHQEGNPQFEVTNGKLVLATYWAESDQFYRFLHVKGNSEVSFIGGRIHTSEYKKIQSFTKVNGSGYVNGSYNEVNLIGGSGQGGRAGLTVVGGAIVTATMQYGSLYEVGDVLTVNNAQVGGSGSGFQLTVTAVNENCTILIEGTNNKVAIGSINFENTTEVRGVSTGSKVLLSTSLMSAPYLVNNATGIDARVIQKLDRAGSGSGALGSDIGSREESFIKPMFDQFRQLNAPNLTPTPDDASDIRLFDVRFEGTGNGFEVSNS